MELYFLLLSKRFRQINRKTSVYWNHPLAHAIHIRSGGARTSCMLPRVIAFFCGQVDQMNHYRDNGFPKANTISSAASSSASGTNGKPTPTQNHFAAKNRLVFFVVNNDIISSSSDAFHDLSFLTFFSLSPGSDSEILKSTTSFRATLPFFVGWLGTNTLGNFC